jgi:hypothetical protein
VHGEPQIGPLRCLEVKHVKGNSHSILVSRINPITFVICGLKQLFDHLGGVSVPEDLSVE